LIGFEMILIEYPGTEEANQWKMGNFIGKISFVEIESNE